MGFDNPLFFDRVALVRTDGILFTESWELLDEEAFVEVYRRYLAHLRNRDSPLLAVLPDGVSDKESDDALLRLFRKLARLPADDVVDIDPAFEKLLADRHLLHMLVEDFYTFWRRYERYLVCYSEGAAAYDSKPYRTFHQTIEHVNHLVRKAYRDVAEHIIGEHPRVYRQMPAGFQVGIIAARKEWPIPAGYENLAEVPFIRQVLINPPLIIDPPENKRTGINEKVDANPLDGLDFDPATWLCYPARVGPLLIHVYFHAKYVGLGTSLANLFELATDEELIHPPDAVYAYGVEDEHFARFGDKRTVFYDDEKAGILAAAVPRGDAFGYFGYLKKMTLTLHNSVVMKRGMLPVHGAMVRITLKDGSAANIVIAGDTGAGKSETLEAFRTLARDTLREMTVIFDDMGSLAIEDDGTVVARGTETGAFVRLDDLSPGYAFDNIDRSVIMSPQKVNARTVLPVTTLHDVLAGTPVDYYLYANNHEPVDDEHPLIEDFESVDGALATFREGKRLAKGTTKESGLVSAYFANVFGPPQYRERHEELAKKFFSALDEQGVRIAQLRTRLGLPGFETEGPLEAAKSLLSDISEREN